MFETNIKEHIGAERQDTGLGAQAFRKRESENLIVMRNSTLAV